jgi:hypothetical protein
VRVHCLQRPPCSLRRHAASQCSSFAREDDQMITVGFGHYHWPVLVDATALLARDADSLYLSSFTCRCGDVDTRLIGPRPDEPRDLWSDGGVRGQPDLRSFPLWPEQSGLQLPTIYGRKTTRFRLSPSPPHAPQMNLARLVLQRQLDMINHDHLYLAFLRFQLKSKLLL